MDSKAFLLFIHVKIISFIPDSYPNDTEKIALATSITTENTKKTFVRKGLNPFSIKVFSNSHIMIFFRFPL